MGHTSGESACPLDRVNCRVDKCTSFREGPCLFAWLMSDLCLNNQAYAVYRMLFPSRDLCRIFAGFLFLDVTYVGSLLKERGIHSVQGTCLFTWLMSNRCLKNEAYTVCRVLVHSSGLCRIFA